MSQEFAPKKTEMGTRRVVLKSHSAVISGGSVESRWHVASMCGRVMFILYIHKKAEVPPVALQGVCLGRSAVYLASEVWLMDTDTTFYFWRAEVDKNGSHCHVSAHLSINHIETVFIRLLFSVFYKMTQWNNNCRRLVYVHIRLEMWYEFKRRLSDSYGWRSELLKG